MFDVCVIGGCSIDIVNYVNNPKENEYYFGGKGANQAVASARAGGKTCIITKIGDDKYGKNVIENLKQNNVTPYAEIVKNCETDFAKINIDKNADNVITRSRNAIDTFSIKDIDKYLDVIKDSKIIVIQLKMPYEVTKYIINLCYDLGKKIVLTPCTPDKISAKNSENMAILNKVTYICANEKESQIVFNTSSSYDSVKLAPNKLIATLGGKGLVYNDGKQNIELPAIKDLNVVDTTGAGDTFCGNLAACLAQGMQLDKAIVRCQYASAYKIQIKSAQAGMPTKAQLDEFIRSKDVIVK